MKGSRIPTLLAMLSVVSGISGCYDYKDIREQSYISLVTIDKGKKEPLRITLQAPKPSKPESGGAGPSFDVITQEGDSITECINNVNNFFGKTPNLAHVRMIIIGEKAAKTSALSDIASLSLRSPQMRASTLVAVTPGDASKLAEVPGGQEDSPVAYYGKFLRRTLATGDSYPSTLYDVLVSGRAGIPSMTLVARIRPMMGFGPKKGQPISLDASGAGVFKAAKLVGWMDEYETQGWLILTKRMKSASIPIKVPKGRIVTVIREVGTEIMTKDKGYSPSGGVRISCTIDADADITDVIGNGNSFISADGMDKLNVLLANELKGRCEAALAKSRKLRVDPFEFGSYVRARTPYYKFKKLDWVRIFQDSTVDIKVTAHIRRSGGLFKNVNPKGAMDPGKAW